MNRSLRATTALAFACLTAVPALAQGPADDLVSLDEIIVTATKRAQSLQDVPMAVAAVDAAALAVAGVSDIRQLGQLTPSLMVSSTSSESVGGVARIRGVGTVGDNAGLESSVATFIDGVYRSRSGIGFTELGNIQRIEVLRGPQGTLFGRNASAGLINIVTAAPGQKRRGYAEASYGNYDALRLSGGVSGPVSESIALGLDGVYSRRDGFIRDVISGRSINNRDRWLLRGQAMIEPSDRLSIRLIADYARRDEECCAAVYKPAQLVTRGADGSLVRAASPVAALLGSLGAQFPSADPYDRKVALTPGASFQSDVVDWGLSAQLDYEFASGITLTAISAYRDWASDRGQDADFSTLDLLRRTEFDQTFKTFTQELRLNGQAFDGRLDWLVGGFYAREKLALADDLRFGSHYGLAQSCLVASNLVSVFGSSVLSPGAPGCVNPAVRPVITSAGALGPVAGGALLSGLDGLSALGGGTNGGNLFRQTSTNYALFTHNVVKLTDRIQLTLGARYTRDRKALDATIGAPTAAVTCEGQRATLGAVAADTALPASVRAVASGIMGLSCASNIAANVTGRYQDRISDGEWSGTAVLSATPHDDLMVYGSYSRGYKAGGFNLDRAGLVVGAPAATQLRFAPEKVNAFELGAKYASGPLRLAATAFHQRFSAFQLNTFNGISFIVENINGCDAATVIGTACAGDVTSGVISKGIELEASARVTPSLLADLGYTLAQTKYRSDLVGAGGRALNAGALFVLPGSQLSNAPQHVLTGGLTWTPPLGNGGWQGLVHADFRHQSRMSTGSDLFLEKNQPAVTVVNARLGVTAPAERWGIELWAQNLFNTDYAQTIAGAPTQGSGSASAILAGRATSASSLFILFPAEPRTWGVTLKGRF